MKKALWVDTSFFYALFVRADANHARACKTWNSCLEERRFCVTSNLIISELGSQLAYRFGHAIAFRQLTLIYDSSVLSIVRADRDIESASLGWWSRFSDQRFSFVDCVSYEFMHRLGMAYVLTFDKDFSIAGFSQYGI